MALGALNVATRICRSDFSWMTLAMTEACTLLIAPGGRVEIATGSAAA